MKKGLILFAFLLGLSALACQSASSLFPAPVQIPTRLVLPTPTSDISVTQAIQPMAQPPSNGGAQPSLSPTSVQGSTVAAPTQASRQPGGQTALIDSPNGRCAVFPADNPWNRDVSKDPIDPNSQNYINYILNSAKFLHADFGSDPAWGFPYVVVPANQAMVPITFTAYGDESDPSPYPIPLDAPIEGGSDHHVLVIRSGECKLYELYNAAQNGAGWQADSGAVFDLNSNKLRPAGWTSADAAGLPIFPGLARYDEVSAGVINHALRFTVKVSQRAYINPATHWASSVTDPNAPPMGLRLRLKADYDTSWIHGQARVIADALKKYGMIVADNGGSWFISGARDPRWNNDDLDQLKKVPGSAFEVVQSGQVVRP
ncbi:MAG: hypothetical protein P4L50_27110 [Anaerolineaceae bacterium]|nr:hypothetical protein [Anaerolineaceae bacterium]